MAALEEVLDLLKLKLLPELQEMKDFRTEVRAEIKVIIGRLDAMQDTMDRRFAEIDVKSFG